VTKEIRPFQTLGFGDRDLFGPFWTFWDFFGPSAVSRGEKEAKIVVVSVD